MRVDPSIGVCGAWLRGSMPPTDREYSARIERRQSTCSWPGGRSPPRPFIYSSFSLPPRNGELCLLPSISRQVDTFFVHLEKQRAFFPAHTFRTRAAHNLRQLGHTYFVSLKRTAKHISGLAPNTTPPLPSPLFQHKRGQ